MAPEVERSLVLSADRGGILGRPRLWNELWHLPLQEAGLAGRLEGFEAFAWFSPANIKAIAREAHMAGVVIVGWHLRTGGVHEAYNWRDRLTMEILNRWLVDTPTAIEVCNSLGKYILIYAPEARRPELYPAIIQANLLYIENHVHVAADWTALGVAREAKAAGVPRVRVMADVGHIYQSHRHTPNTVARIGATVANLRDIMVTAKTLGIDGVDLHIPLGEQDCLDAKVRLAVVGEVAQLINSPGYAEMTRRIVVESQPRFPAALYMAPWAVSSYLDLNREILEVVNKSGILGEPLK